MVGLLVEDPEMRGRAIRQTPILGTVEELQEILRSLEVHGVAVNRIVIATTANRLQPRSLKSLLDLEKSSNTSFSSFGGTWPGGRLSKAVELFSPGT